MSKFEKIENIPSPQRNITVAEVNWGKVWKMGREREEREKQRK
jgi:hypothetical protein